MSIEEDIQRCKELIKSEHSNWIGIRNQNAIKTILGNLDALCDMQKTADIELKNAKKINEEHMKENENLKKQIKILEAKIKYLESASDCLSGCLTQSIPKRKIKDKIKEYKELVDDFEKTDNTGRFKRTNSIDYYKLEAFEELLQEEDK